MALETERRSPDNASSPGLDRPGSSGSCSGSGSASGPEERRPSAFHRIELLCESDKFPSSIGLLPRVPIAPVYGPGKEVALAVQPQQPAAPSSLPFSVDNILRPEFGKSAAVQAAAGRRGSATPGATPGPRRRTGGEDEYPDPAKIDPPIPDDPGSQIWPAWVYCTRYSDRPSSGPRSRRIKRKEKSKEDKRPRTAFSGEQLARLKSEFSINRYLTERRRQALASELGLNEAQIKIWFQNKRAKIKKASGSRNPLALQLMAQGLYNHSTVPMSDDESEESVNSMKH